MARRSSLAMALGLNGQGNNGDKAVLRLDTNAKLAETIETALRETWSLKKEREGHHLARTDRYGDSVSTKTKRLSVLYGLSPLAPHVKSRSVVVKRSKSRRFPHLRTEHTISNQSEKGNNDSSNPALTVDVSFDPLHDMTEAQLQELHAWYCGHLNYVPDHLPLPPSSYIRYGRLGAVRMRARIENMLEHHEPVLSDWQRRDWKPSLIGSPHVWDSDAAYVSGSILKDEVVNREPCNRLVRFIERDHEQRRREKDELKEERMNRPPKTKVTTQKKINFVTTFQRQLKYLHNYTLIAKEKETAEGLKTAAEKDQTEKSIKEKSKWERLSNLYQVMRLPGYRSASLRDVHTLYIEFMKLAETNTSRKHISREQFLHVLFNIYGKEMKVWDINRLYSSFDLEKVDLIDFREFVASVRILRMATEKPYEKLSALFALFDLDDENSISFADLVSLLQTCSVTADEKRKMVSFAIDFLEDKSSISLDLLSKPRSVEVYSDSVASIIRMDRSAFLKKIKTNTELLVEFHNQMYERLPESLKEDINRTKMQAG